ncbi:MAG: non-homologous end-joining DNA ligase, partial [Patescibacteria group bacterium]
DFVVDGELVAFKDGQTSFSRLQKRMQVTQPDQAVIARTAIFLYLFDVLCLNDRDLRPLPLQTRKQLLKQAISFSSRHIRYTLHRRADGVAFWREACAKGWEGVIAKRAASTYASIRSQDWLKFKCLADQELVIGGYTAPAGERFGFGALLVGYYEAGALRYAGKVGTGFDEETLRYLYDLFQEYTRSTSPFADPTGEQRVTWLSPKFVAEIGFTEWTHEGKLRHPRFKGLRQDKRPKEVSKESI